MNLTGNLSVCGMTPKQLSHTGWGITLKTIPRTPQGEVAWDFLSLWGQEDVLTDAASEMGWEAVGQEETDLACGRESVRGRGQRL